MFHWLRRREVADRALRLGRTMVLLRAMADRQTYEEFVRWIFADEFVKWGSEEIEIGRRSTWFLDSSAKDPDLVFHVTHNARSLDPDYLHLLVTGYGRFAGLLLIDNVRGAGVAVDILQPFDRTRRIGSHTRAIRENLLGFPGFMTTT